MRSTRIRVCEVLVGLILVLAGAAWPAAWPGCEIVSQSDAGITLAFKLPGYSLEEMTANGRTYTRIVSSGLVSFAGAGEPDLPALSVLLAVPPGGGAAIESFTRSGERSFDGVRVAPVETVEAYYVGGMKFADYTYLEDESVYGADSRFPEGRVWLEDRGRFRHQDVVRLTVSPFVFEPASERLYAANEITVRIRFDGHSGYMIAPFVEDRWERIYKDCLINYQQGRLWRTRSAAPLRGAAPANGRIKITIEKTGIYRLGFDTLADKGFPQGTAIEDVFLYKDEFREGNPDTVETAEVAIRIDDEDQDQVFSSGDEIEFFVRDLYDEFGRQGGEDYFFDKNIYWLSWGEGDHKRMTSRSGWREGASPSKPQHFTDMVHVEKDSVFVNFPATGDIDFYAWRRYSATVPFTAPGLDETLGGTVVANFVNYIVPERTATTRIIFGLIDCNGIQRTVDTISVYVPSVRRFTIPYEPGFLCEGTNSFVFKSKLDAQINPGNILDWFEVFYERRYEAYEDVLVFSNGGQTGELEFEVNGFSTSDIMLLDITGPTDPVRIELDPDQITPDGGGFKFTFRDSASGDKRYIALCMPSVLTVSVDDLDYKDPPRLRTAFGDYLIISHPDFVGELDPLMSKRQEQGHTILLATTEEVYDDFGNGMKSDVAIKRFIKHQFLSTGAEFVLLVGDANVDRRGLLLDVPVGGYPPPSDVDYVPAHNLIISDGRPPNKEIRPSEYWFVSVDGPSDVYPDLYLGRLPVGNTGELAAVIGKILTFENYEDSDPWKKRIFLLADDEYKIYVDAQKKSYICYRGEVDFMQACDSVAYIASNYAVVPPETLKYYLAWCVKDDQPDRRCAASTCCTDFGTTWRYVRNNCTPEVRSHLNSGWLLVNYQGHANRHVFAHENMIYDQGSYYRDIRDLQNLNKPFIFAGFGCWMSDFQTQAEGDPGTADAIGEKFLLSANGAGCASFASGCSELISQNRRFNPFVTRAMLTHLTGFDLQGNPVPARVLAGEAVLTALLRFGSSTYIERHIFLGDPAMVVDMGPPSLEVTVDDIQIDENFVLEAEVADAVRVVAEIKDEEAIMSIDLEWVIDEVVVPIPADSFSTVAVVDTGFVRSRVYEVIYSLYPWLGEYVLRISGEDYVGKRASFDLNINTGSARFFRDDVELPEGGSLVFGQTLRIPIVRPFAFTEENIEVLIDSIPATEFEGYSVVQTDTGGKEWEVSFIPVLTPGDHVARVTVQGLQTERQFEYIPTKVGFRADGRNLYEHDFISPDAVLEIMVQAQAGLTGEDIEVDLDGQPYPVSFAADSSGTTWKATFDLETTPGTHELGVTVFNVTTVRRFQLAEEFMAVNISVFPNPFRDEAYLFYTLSQEAEGVTLSIFTVSGRKIYEAELTAFAGYNEFRWDGNDMAGDRVANGTYIYRLAVRSDSGEKEFIGRLAKIE